MQFNNNIFHELEAQDIDPIANEYFMNEIYPKIVKKNGKDPLIVDLIPYDSLIYDALIAYFGDEEKIMQTARAAVPGDEGIYFVTGVGYDIYDKDLLGGNGNGHTRTKFIDFLNQDH